MGDRKAKEESDIIAQKILAKGLFTPELRDEIYCQLCKQTCYNPTMESMYLGWSLLVLCIQYFPPSRDLEAWIKQYFTENIQQTQPKIPDCASYCLRRLPVICRVGAKQKLPSLKEIEMDRGAAFRTAVYGGYLEKIMENPEDQELPRILTKLIGDLTNLGAHKVEGIFRVPGTDSKVMTAKSKIEDGDYSGPIDDPHVAASLLKLWFRQLAQPVFSGDIYNQCIQSSTSVPLSVSIAKQLPPAYFRVLHYLIKYLQMVCAPENVEKNRMTQHNVAMVFAPCILSCPSDNPNVIYTNQKHELEFVKNLIRGL